MKYTGPTYRPPYESLSVLLQVTVGCSHNRCSFCSMYREVPFSVAPMEEIEADLEEASRRYWRRNRVFLENGDAFTLSADRLAVIAEKIHEKLPNVETIAMYASINNIRSKTDEELRWLHALGINDLNVGLESGYDPALERMQKGYDSAEARRQLLRLKAAGIDFGANVILGILGPDHARAHAIETAELLNDTKPNLIFTGTLHAEPGCPLYDWMKAGQFKESTVGELIDEQELFLEQLEVENCRLFGKHPSNVVSLYGMLGRDKEKMLAELREERSLYPPEVLSACLSRYAEGAVRL